MSFTWGRKRSDCSLIPLMVTFEGFSLPLFGKFIITISSLAASLRPFCPIAISGWASTIDAWYLSIPLCTSVVEARRIMITLSYEPVSTRVLRSPSASMRMVAKTKTTSAIPEAVRIVVSRRVKRLRKVYDNGILIYPIFLKPSAIRIFTACHVGKAAAIKPTKNEAATSRRRVIADTSNTGKKLPMVLPKYSAPGNVSMIPSTQPVMVITRDSPRISMAICQPPNPSVFMMAYSPILSRAVMAMVLATTAMMIMITMKETSWITVTMASVMVTKLIWNAFSVSVRVSASEFLNVLSTASDISAAWSGSSIAMM